MKVAKAKSSKWINDFGFLPERFEWQSGFGTFSYSRSHIENVYQYIQNQEHHHSKTTFLAEYAQLLAEYDIDYDDQYIFKSLI